MKLIYSVGHSTRSWEQFVSLLRENGIRTVADIRSFPGSRKFPWFNREPMTDALAAAGIAYTWLPSLGGYRKRGLGESSPNAALTSPGFRNYADHMLGREFREGVEELLARASGSPTAFLCAERFYWRCHRRLLSDHLASLGWEVIHVVGEGERLPHRLTRGASIEAGGRVVYPKKAKYTNS